MTAALAAVAVAGLLPLAAAGGWQRRGAGLESRAADVHVGLTGYVQLDGRGFPGWPEADPDGLALQRDGVEVRRLRLGVEARWRRVEFELDGELKPGDEELKDAFLDVRFSRAARLRAGRFKIPVGAEWLVSAAKTDFVERALPIAILAPDRDWGVELHGDIGRLTYMAGLFAGDGLPEARRAGTTAAARLRLAVSNGLELAGACAWADVAADATGPGLDPRPRGLLAEGLGGETAFAPVFVNGRRLRWGVEGAWRSGPVSLRAEWLEARERRLGQGPTLGDLPELVGRGWAASASWLVTGERKRDTVRPERPLFGGPGAVELALRYDVVRFDDAENAGFEGAGNRSRNVRPAGLEGVTAGVSWWPGSWLRLVANLALERYADAARAPEPGRAGWYRVLLARVQLQVP